MELVISLYETLLWTEPAQSLGQHITDGCLQRQTGLLLLRRVDLSLSPALSANMCFEAVGF